jgi:hypothetical protein
MFRGQSSLPPTLHSSSPTMKQSSRKEELENSTTMMPVEGRVEVNVPPGILWEAFCHPDWWPRWNSCFSWVHTKSLSPGKRLVWSFHPIKRWYLYRMFAIARIVEVEKEQRVTWEVTALPGFYARHTYYIEDLGDGRSRFGTWEKATGTQLRFWLTRRFWLSHFTFVKDRSIEGVRLLETIYQRERRLTSEVLPPRHFRSNRFAPVKHPGH